MLITYMYWFLACLQLCNESVVLYKVMDITINAHHLKIFKDATPSQYIRFLQTTSSHTIKNADSAINTA